MPAVPQQTREQAAALPTLMGPRVHAAVMGTTVGRTPRMAVTHRSGADPGRARGPPTGIRGRAHARGHGTTLAPSARGHARSHGSAGGHGPVRARGHLTGRGAGGHGRDRGHPGPGVASARGRHRAGPAPAHAHRAGRAAGVAAAGVGGAGMGPGGAMTTTTGSAGHRAMATAAGLAAQVPARRAVTTWPCTTRCLWATCLPR
mmetsp:Transcript_2187/g.5559  ORF Transcript_2187/g.5559 Transcript_2187/m.5559 type:complete len:203 (+) Transcript_2187:974-1582(+)